MHNNRDILQKSIDYWIVLLPLFHTFVCDLANVQVYDNIIIMYNTEGPHTSI